MDLDEYWDALCYLIPDKGLATVIKGAEWDFKYHAILFILEKTRGNVARASYIARVEPERMWADIEQYGIDPKVYYPRNKKSDKSKSRE